MTAIRRTALTLALTLTAVLGSAGATARPRSPTRPRGPPPIAAATVVAPGNVKGSSSAAGPRHHGGDLDSAPRPGSPATS